MRVRFNVAENEERGVIRFSTSGRSVDVNPDGAICFVAEFTSGFIAVFWQVWNIAKIMCVFFSQHSWDYNKESESVGLHLLNVKVKLRLRNLPIEEGNYPWFMRQFEPSSVYTQLLCCMPSERQVLSCSLKPQAKRSQRLIMVLHINVTVIIIKDHSKNLEVALM